MITGLVLFGIGALMFIPGSRINSFYFFVPVSYTHLDVYKRQVYGCEDNKIISNIVMFRLNTLTILGSKAELASLPEGKLLINTVNAQSVNTANKDQLFAEMCIRDR